MNQDKYEAFKSYSAGEDTVIYDEIMRVCHSFEREWTEKQEKEKIKDILLHEFTKGLIVDEIYKVLKEGDYLK